MGPMCCRSIYDIPHFARFHFKDGDPLTMVDLTTLTISTLVLNGNICLYMAPVITDQTSEVFSYFLCRYPGLQTLKLMRRGGMPVAFADFQVCNFNWIVS